MTNTLTIAEVVEWLRDKAKELNQTADTLETAMGIPLAKMMSTAPANANGNGKLIHVATANPVSIADAIRSKRGAGRAKEIAKRLGATREQILKIVKANPQTFEVHRYGWIKMKQNGGS